MIAGDGIGTEVMPEACACCAPWRSASACLRRRRLAGTEREIMLQEPVMRRIGIDRVLRFTFELAASRPRAGLTSATEQ